VELPVALITLNTPSLGPDQKKRLGDRIIYALQQEQIPPSSVVLIFKHETSDIYLDGLLVEAEKTAVSSAPARPSLPNAPLLTVSASEPANKHAHFKNKPRRNKAELEELKNQLMKHLQSEGSMSSFDAQKKLGLDDCDWAPATLRRFFTELEEEGAISKSGQKRGTRYLWKGLLANGAPPQSSSIKLVKADSGE
jgi:hypothetical protein